MIKIYHLVRAFETAHRFIEKEIEKRKEHGVYAVRSPHNMPDSLLHEIETVQHE